MTKYLTSVVCQSILHPSEIIQNIKDLFHQAFDSWPTEELIALDWQITLEVKVDDIVAFIDLWEYKNNDLILEAIEQERWKTIFLNLFKYQTTNTNITDR